ncbi:hypothetical protein V2S66_20810 [Streptomyces sp. V4-01]|uniref:Uncharacterized protein n=1 Tax=Actinacidiphila polyblastidii TaxID=3110430 RepID=A0ABU7PF11_9ACTN|nr:hypothetical protein [Streptomyces sp. V4-01]
MPRRPGCQVGRAGSFEEFETPAPAEVRRQRRRGRHQPDSVMPESVPGGALPLWPDEEFLDGGPETTVSTFVVGGDDEHDEEEQPLSSPRPTPSPRVPPGS